MDHALQAGGQPYTARSGRQQNHAVDLPWGGPIPVMPVQRPRIPVIPAMQYTEDVGRRDPAVVAATEERAAAGEARLAQVGRVQQGLAEARELERLDARCRPLVLLSRAWVATLRLCCLVWWVHRDPGGAQIIVDPGKIAPPPPVCLW